MINKKIFYVWGANDAPKQNMWLNIQTWKNKCPDYEIIEINEESKEYFNFQEELKNNKWFKAVYERKMWAYVSDYVRIKVLYDNGGIYLDTDVTVLKSFDKFLEEPAFVGIQKAGKYNRVEPAILGAEKGNAFIGKILDFYNKGIWEEKIFTMPDVFGNFLTKEYGITKYPPKAEQEIIKLKEITIYPQRYFIPFEFKQNFTYDCIEPDTHTIHWFGGSWVDKKTKRFLKNKHKILGLIPRKLIKF